MAPRRTKPSHAGTFTAVQAARVAGLTMHMVDYLCRHELVTPSGDCERCRGRRRQYTFADIVLLRVVAKLLGQGISVLGFRKSFLSAKQRQENLREILARRYLVTDGVRVYLQNGGVLERIDSGQISFAFVMDLVPVRRDLQLQLYQKRRAE